MPVPLKLLSIYNDETEVGRHSRQHIRMYNHIFAFTSMGVHLDGDLANGREGVYSFRAQGAIYHKIGGFLPSSSERPRFMQLYIYDTDNEIKNRVAKNPTMNVELIERLRSILDVHNPFVHRFRQLEQEPNIENSQLIIREQPRNRPQYNLPTASEVAAIIVSGEEAGQLNGRDIIVQSHSGHLMNVPDIARYYDPLQYPLLFPFDIFLKMETQKFRWVRNNQSKIRAEMYNGLQDSFEAGINISGHVGRRIILPSSIVGYPRDMGERFQDAMRVVGREVTAYAYVIEIQKRGLPHAHMLLILGDDDKLNFPDVYDQAVKAEIPLQSDQLELYTCVLKHMIHGPCGTINSCTQKGKCKKHFLKPFVPYTIHGNDCYPLYQRRDMGQVPLGRGRNVRVDNSWVVPYNPWLLLKYNCHINVAICSSVKSVKYLYKYINKGPDRVNMMLCPESNIDEVKQYIDARWVCAPEALWRIYKFPMS
ncbi:putative helitron helicase-like domain-containing protein [Senna tora]|uniref:Putative helitron helicase-like domain-containing protein n=1 Tax=Senna tora TaxID=362788 RepID=A0A834SRC2_9FABA|nr:putative helitron helicase-like domain-containing protein [Senna tora]